MQRRDQRNWSDVELWVAYVLVRLCPKTTQELGKLIGRDEHLGEDRAVQLQPALERLQTDGVVVRQPDGSYTATAAALPLAMLASAKGL